jgi:shikimate dehydrogenase
MSARVGLIGHPVAHSISAAFQQAAFDALEIDARYETWDLSPDELESCVDGLRAAGTLGCNITNPYKEAAARYVDRLHQTARFVGAINTIANDSGVLVGYNTDVAGFQTALKGTGFDPTGARATIWGAGGAARAVAWALIWRGIQSLTIVNRTAVRAGRLRHDLAAASADIPLRAYGADQPEAVQALAGADLVVQCTPVGMQGGSNEGQVPFDVGALKAGATVMDLIANPAESALVKAARVHGHQAIGGLPMLVYQGAAAFEIWTQQRPPIETMLEAAAAAMQRES